MTAKKLILTTGAVLALAAPAANAATLPVHAKRHVHKSLVRTQKPLTAISGGTSVGFTCSNVDPAYPACVGASANAAEASTAAAPSVEPQPSPDVTQLVGKLNVNVCDG